MSQRMISLASNAYVGALEKDRNLPKIKDHPAFYYIPEVPEDHFINNLGVKIQASHYSKQFLKKKTKN